MKKNTIVEIISALLVFLFLYAALNKLLEFDRFKYQVGQSPFLTRISPMVVWVIPIGEIFISVALLVRRTRLAGLHAAFFLMLLFTGYIFIMLRYSPYLPCSCGGVLAGLSWKQHFVFNGVFAGLSLAGIALQNSNRDHIKNAFAGKKLNT